jgi:colicin import membrane protein
MLLTTSAYSTKGDITSFICLFLCYLLQFNDSKEFCMRPVEFAPAAIIQAGQDLKATGRNITGFALRQKVGGGNPSRLKQVWDEYLASQSMTKTEPVAELPIEVAEEVATVTKALTERLSALAVELNDKAVKAAERRVHEVVRSAGEQRDQAERELADASQTVDDMEEKLDEAKAEVDALKTRLVEAQTISQVQAVELAQLRERLAVTEQASQDQRKSAAEEERRFAERVKKGEADQEQARNEAISAREEAAKLRGQVEVMQAQIKDLLAVFTASPSSGVFDTKKK